MCNECIASTTFPKTRSLPHRSPSHFSNRTEFYSKETSFTVVKIALFPNRKYAFFSSHSLLNQSSDSIASGCWNTLEQIKLCCHLAGILTPVCLTAIFRILLLRVNVVYKMSV